LEIHYQSYMGCSFCATEPNPDLTSGEVPISPRLYQTEAPLEDELVSPQLAVSLVRVLVFPFSEEPPEHELALPQPEAPLEDGLFLLS